MAGKVRTWVWIVAAVFIVGVLGLVAIAALSVYYFSQHIETRDASPATAAREFQEIRDRFSGQKPLIELNERGRLLRTNPDRPAQATPRRPDQLNVLVFEPDEGPHGRIVRVTIPFWLLRLKSGSARIDLNDSPMDLEDLKITIEDLERYGPTLLVDHKSPTGQHVLVWSQ